MVKRQMPVPAVRGKLIATKLFPEVYNHNPRVEEAMKKGRKKKKVQLNIGNWKHFITISKTIF